LAGNVFVVDWSQVEFGCIPIGQYLGNKHQVRDDEMIEYVKNLLFRSVVMISDTNNRNLVIVKAAGKKGTIYSIDEMNIFAGRKASISNLFSQKPSKEWGSKVDRCLEENSEMFVVVLESWLSKNLDDLFVRFLHDSQKLKIVRENIITLKNEITKL
jgi:hypothetical protein